jgi:hypothetical protein
MGNRILKIWSTSNHKAKIHAPTQNITDSQNNIVRHTVREQTDLLRKWDKISLDSYSSLVLDYAKRSEVYYHEFLALGHKFERHEHWIEQLARKTQTKLDTKII